jgi:hypothetical protein
MKKVVKSIGLAGYLAIKAKGRAGGICMMWSNALDVEIIEFNSHIIAIVIKEEYCSWSLIGFYGPPYRAKRKKAWEKSLCTVGIYLWAMGLCR